MLTTSSPTWRKLSPRPARSDLSWVIHFDGSQQSEGAQFAAQVFGHGARPRGGAVEIARGVLGIEIAPALERPVGPRLDQHRLAIERDVATADALRIDEGRHGQDALAAHDLAADNPVERAAVEK